VPGFEIGVEPDRRPTVIYLHGGGFIIGSAFGHRPLIGALAAAGGETILAPEFRLAPEHPFPAAVEDTDRAFEWMLERGTPAERVVFAGDSAGCALAMSVVLTRREKGLPLPGGLLFFCPGLDFSGSTLERMATEDEEVALMLKHLKAHADAYLGGHSIDDPIVSSLRADLTGLPPILIQAATGDPQREDAHILNERARAAGVDSQLELYPVETHAFQTFWSFLPEAMQAVERGGEFVRGVASGEVAAARTG
jgi:acetyl esterase/lipase